MSDNNNGCVLNRNNLSMDKRWSDMEEMKRGKQQINQCGDDFRLIPMNGSSRRSQAGYEG
jgi:hypothetical protein